MREGMRLEEEEERERERDTHTHTHTHKQTHTQISSYFCTTISEAECSVET